MPGIIDYSEYLDSVAVKKLIANGSLWSEDKKYVLIQEDYLNQGQQQTEIDAPIVIVVFFSMFLVENDDELTKVYAFDAEGAPAQAYNYAVTKFAQLISQIG